MCKKAGPGGRFLPAQAFGKINRFVELRQGFLEIVGFAILSDTL
jgi:hypothetical protein